MVVLDIGANTGAITALAADCVGASGRVIAYEPTPETAAGLSERFRDAPHVTVRPAAVSDQPGSVVLHLDAKNSMRHTLYASIVSVPGGTITVPTVCLDHEAAHFAPVDVIKIDAQGAEGRIIAGGRRLLRRDQPLLVFELWPAGLKAAGTTAEALLADLAAWGYRCVRLSVKGRLKSEAAVAAFLAEPPERWAAINVVAWPPRWPPHSIARSLRSLLSRKWLSAAVR
jgi:FkbM family methyltransferase